QGGRLTRAIGTKEPECLTNGHLDVDAAYSDHVAISLDQSGRPDHRRLRPGSLRHTRLSRGAEVPHAWHSSQRRRHPAKAFSWRTAERIFRCMQHGQATLQTTRTSMA